MRKRDLGVIASLPQSFECGLDIGLSNEEVEVLRLPHDSSVVEQRVRAADQERDARIAQNVQSPPIKGVGVAGRVFERGLIGHGRTVEASCAGRVQDRG